MESYVRTDIPKLASIVGSLNSHPPVNFNVSLKMHAIPHGVKVHAIEYEGPRVKMTVSAFNFDSVHRFANSLPAKFPHVLHDVKVSPLNAASVPQTHRIQHFEEAHPLGASSEHVSPHPESPYLTPQ